jgi:hypothetical protein
MTVRAKTVVVHIGSPKTGSTSIQEMLIRAADGGSLGPVRYPLWPGDRDHNRLITLYHPHNQLLGWWWQGYPADDLNFQRMRRQFRTFLFTELGAARVAVISAELLFHSPPAGVARLRLDLESMGFTEFHIVLYVRDPADFYLSETQQRLKSPREARIEDPQIFRYGFLRAADIWERAFPGSLTVRRALSQPGEDVTDDFCGLLQDLFDVSLPPQPERMNTSLSAEGMKILLDYRQRFWPDNGGLVTPDVGRLVSFLKESRKALPQTRPVLKDDAACAIRANHSADAAVILDRYDIDLGLRDLAPPDPPSATAGHSNTPVRLDDILESVDPVIVERLLLELARTELPRPSPRRPLTLRMAARAYRSIRPSRRPRRLDGWLR